MFYFCLSEKTVFYSRGTTKNADNNSVCRSKAEGGRRCPYHSTKEWRDKYNAYRRAKYAEQKQQKVVNLPPETEHPGEPQGYAQHNIKHVLYL